MRMLANNALRPYNDQAMKIKKALSYLLTLSLLSITTSLLPVKMPAQPLSEAHATTLTELQKKQQELAKQKAAKAAQEAAQKALAAKAAAKAQEVAGQINVLQDNIESTQSNIQTVQQQIEQKNQDIANLESDLRKIKDQQNILVRQMYVIRASMPDETLLFANHSVSDTEKTQAQLSALKKSVATIFEKTTAAKLAVEGARNDLVKKNEDLNNLASQQDSQKKGLASYQDTQLRLKQNAEQTVKDLQAQELALAKQMGQIEQQIASALTAAINKARTGNFSGGGRGVGTHVSKGQLIGGEGNTGYSFGAHVHEEVRVDNSPVNPRPYINNGTIRWAMDSFRVTQEFGWTIYAQQGLYGGGIHTGIDIAAPEGTPVYAAANGTIIMNAVYGGYGNAFAIQLDANPSVVVLYGHLKYTVF
jgi:septal ring factor EnvC (AmiA/AmiB activator)